MARTAKSILEIRVSQDLAPVVIVVLVLPFRLKCAEAPRMRGVDVVRDKIVAHHG